jgi:hypothetical protein
MIDLIRGLFIHIYLLLTFQHDGSGLPVKKSAAFIFLFFIGIFATILEIIVERQNNLLLAVFLYCLIILFYIIFFRQHGWTIASAYICVMTGFILIEWVSIALHGQVKVFWVAYQMLVMIVAFTRIMRTKY